METLNRIDGVDPTYILIGVEDYARYPAPKWARATDSWECQYVARKKVNAVQAEKQYDALFVSSWEFVTAFSGIARRIPAAAMMDVVPATIDAQLRRRGYGGWKRSVASRIQEYPFRRAVRNFRYFLPMGSDCADSLVRHYGIGRDRCLVTLAPQDLTPQSPPSRQFAPPLRLLFIANDFERKGGDFLLRLFRDKLTATCTLTIASNDQALLSRQLPQGVIWLKGRNREQLLEVYRQSDLFVFPTRQDFMPQVLAEALAAGVPCLASDVGGIRDLVIDNQTGFLMPYNASPEAWAEKIGFLFSRPEELSRLAAGASSFAEKQLGAERFQNLIESVVERLRQPSGATNV